METGLNCGKSFKELAEALNKNRTTIMREVQKHKLKKHLVSLTILGIFVFIEENAENLIVINLRNAMLKIHVKK